jgi:hypothetical protein
LTKKKLFTTPGEDLLSGKPKVMNAFGSLNMEAAKIDAFNTLQSFDITQNHNTQTGFDGFYKPVFTNGLI